MKNKNVVLCAAMLALFAQNTFGANGRQSGDRNFVKINTDAKYEFEEENGNGTVEYGMPKLEEAAFDNLTENGLLALLNDMTVDEAVLNKILRIRTAAVEEAKERLGDYKKKLTENEKKLSSLNDEMGKLKTEKDDLSGEVDKLKNENTDLKNKIKELEEEIERLKEENEKLKKELDELKGNLSSVTDKKTKFEEKAKKRKDQKHELQDLAAEYKDRYQQLKNVVELLVNNTNTIVLQVNSSFNSICKELDIDKEKLKDAKSRREIQTKVMERLGGENRALDSAKEQFKTIQEKAQDTLNKINDAMAQAERGVSKNNNKVTVESTLTVRPLQIIDTASKN